VVIVSAAERDGPENRLLLVLRQLRPYGIYECTDFSPYIMSVISMGVFRGEGGGGRGPPIAQEIFVLFKYR